jgi:hypothetical protein
MVLAQTDVRIVAREWVTRHPLVASFVLSLLIHFLLFGGWRFGKAHGWWDYQATWLLNWHKKKRAAELSAHAQKPPDVVEREIPLAFIEVDPSAATPEPPKEAKYYSAQNSRAAQPDPTVETPTPKVDGVQEQVPRLEDVSKPKPFPLQPAVAAEPQEAQPEPKPKGAEKPGDLALVRAQDVKPLSPGVVNPGEAAPARERPRTLAQARAQKGLLAGEKMKQDGGAKSRGRLAVDVKATAFGAYDAAFIAAVQQRWYDLLDSGQFVQRSGKVALEFKLTYDGRIIDLRVEDSDVGEMLTLVCQRAVLDPAPYAPWPNDMRRVIGANHREVMFTFYYH